MKLLLTCFKCMELNQSMPQNSLYNVTMTDSGLINMTCMRGHTSYTMLQNEKFEVLYEMGIYAFQDGYNRESISSFAASLERFYEYSVRLFCNIKGIDDQIVDQTWKTVSAQSERQFGAFYFLYMLIFGRPPTMISNKMTAFRNDVIHKGFIPDDKETFEYAEAVYNFIMSEILKYKQMHGDNIQQMTFKRLQRLHSESQPAYLVNVATCYMPTALSFTLPNDQIPPFSEIIKKHRIP